MQQYSIAGEILHLSVPTPTVETAAQAAGTHPGQIVKSILFLVDSRPVLAITCGTQPVEQRVIASLFGVGRKRVKLASPQAVLDISGYEVGAMPPFGHRQPLPTLLDRRVLEQPVVYAGGGAENALVRITISDSKYQSCARPKFPILVKSGRRISSGFPSQSKIPMR